MIPSKLFPTLERLKVLALRKEERLKNLNRGMLFALALLALPLTALGTVVMYMDLSEMTKVSDVIVHAKVLESKVLEDQSRPITTRISVEAVRVLKGQNRFDNGRLWFDLLGGERDGMQIRVPGTPLFRAGEEVVLFLEKNSTDYALCGLQQGVFRIGETSEGKVVSRDLSGAAYATFGHKGRYSMMHDAPEGVTAYPLAALLDEVQLYIDDLKRGSK